MFEGDRPDERLVFLATKLLLKAGRKEDAAAHLWRAFEKEPSRELYAQLRKLGGATARDRALKFLEAPLVNAKRGRSSSSAELFICILMQEKMFDAAWAALRRHGASMNLAVSLAKVSEATHPQEAVETYTQRVDELTNIGGDPAYAEAAKLVARMAALRTAPEQAAYVLALKARFGRRRKFMTVLM
jgi:hypothetical protein